MIQNIIDNLKNQRIEIDLAQSNLIQEMIETSPQDKSFISKIKKSKLDKTSFYISPKMAGIFRSCDCSFLLL